MQLFNNNKKCFVFVILIFLLTIGLHDAYAFQDFTAKITTAYINDSGSMLIKIDKAHGSPNGWLSVGHVSNANQRMMYANALVAKVTNRSCWVRVTSQASGYWTVNIISIH